SLLTFSCHSPLLPRPLGTFFGRMKLWRLPVLTRTHCPSAGGTSIIQATKRDTLLIDLFPSRIRSRKAPHSLLQARHDTPPKTSQPTAPTELPIGLLSLRRRHLTGEPLVHRLGVASFRQVLA